MPKVIRWTNGMYFYVRGMIGDYYRVVTPYPGLEKVPKNECTIIK